jgi:hypothetical protein
MKISNVPMESHDTHSIEMMSIPIEGQLRENTHKCGWGQPEKSPLHMLNK